jgi:hypothetical protein
MEKEKGIALMNERRVKSHHDVSNEEERLEEEEII